MDNEMIGGKLKMIYKDVEVPDGFSARVMLRIKAEKVQSLPLSIPSRLARDLRPYIAIAACFVLLVGLYFAGSGLPGVSPIDEKEAVIVPVEADPSLDIKIADRQPYLNGDVSLTSEREEKPADLLSPSNENQPVVEDSLAQNGQLNDVADTSAVIEIPVVEPSEPVMLVAIAQTDDRPTLKDPSTKPDPPAANGYADMTVKDPITEIKLIEDTALTFVLNEADIPDLSVFMPHRRVIDSVSVNISVGTINSGVLKLEQRERLFDISADVEVTEIRPDGTIVIMRSYVLPTSFANAFVTQLSALGDDARLIRNSLDITQDYTRLLDAHRELIADLPATGQGVDEINRLVSELKLFDERSREGVRNVVVFLEDAVDF